MRPAFSSSPMTPRGRSTTRAGRGNGQFRATGPLLAALLVVLFLAGCAYHDRVAPINLPDQANGIVVGDGLRITAQAFTDPAAAQKAFGFNARKAGLLPVQLTFQNDGSKPVTVNPAQTFLIDQRNRAWPILSLDQTYQRTRGYVDVGETLKGSGKPSLLLGAAGAVAGLAMGIVSGDNAGEAAGKGAALGAAAGAILGGAQSYAQSGEKIREDLAAKRLEATPILPNQIAYGVLFFPGAPQEEAQGARELRLSLTIGDRTQVVRLPLSNGRTSPAGPATRE